MVTTVRGRTGGVRVHAVAVALVAVMTLGPGCSWLLVDKPREYSADCTSSYLWPVTDMALWFPAYFAGGLVLATSDPGPVLFGVGLLMATGFSIAHFLAGVQGVRKVGLCRDIRRYMSSSGGY